MLFLEIILKLVLVTKSPLIKNELQYFFRNVKRSNISSNNINVKTISRGTSQKNLLLKMAHFNTENQLSVNFDFNLSIHVIEGTCWVSLFYFGL